MTKRMTIVYKNEKSLFLNCEESNINSLVEAVLNGRVYRDDQGMPVFYTDPSEVVHFWVSELPAEQPVEDHSQVEAVNDFAARVEEVPAAPESGQ